MRVGPLAALACLAAFARAEKYTLLHRSTGNGARESPWATRALITLENDSDPVYEPVAEWSASPGGDAAYQLILVPGDARSERDVQARAAEQSNPIAYSPEVRDC